MYFKDLSRYVDSNKCVYNIGWLDSNNIINTGQFPESLLIKLIIIEEMIKTNQTRGVHECELCKESADGNYSILGKKLFLGSAELWIPNKENTKIYIAPDLILHYIYSHNYLPPLEFIEAVSDFNVNSSWNIETISFFRG